MVRSQQNVRFFDDYNWLAALGNRGTLSSLRILLDLICNVKLTVTLQSSIGRVLTDKLAAGIQLHPGFRSDIYARLSSNLPMHSRMIIESVIAEVPDESGIALLVRSHASDGREFSSVLASAIKHIVVEQQPSLVWAGAYDQISKDSTSLRKQLFQLALSSAHHLGNVAIACLCYIDELRDMHGVPSTEPRHPDIDSGVAWPLLTNESLGNLTPHTDKSTSR